MKKQKSATIKFIKSHDGYAHAKDLRMLGLQTRQIRALLADGTLTRVKRGLYKLSDSPIYEHSQLVDICTAKQQAVIALASALEFYGLTTYSPSEITIALPRNFSYATFQKTNLPVKVYYFPKSYYQHGIETRDIKGGKIRIYNKEKTICDMFRYRKTFGDDIALEALKNYLTSKKANIQLLQKYATICNINTIITPYIKAMVVR